MPAFEKGNKHGGARERAGRKPDIVRKTLDAILHGDAENPKGLVDDARKTLAQAMTDRDDGRVTSAGVRAAETVFAYEFGKPRQSIEVRGGDDTLGNALKAAGEAVATGVLEDVWNRLNACRPQKEPQPGKPPKALKAPRPPRRTKPRPTN